MKYCSKCGKELVDEAVVCTECGCPTESFNKKSQFNDETLKTIIKVFMILGTIFMGLLLIPLAWCIPMTLKYYSKVENKEKISTAFKICTLLFVNLVAGILMLCDEN